LDKPSPQENQVLIKVHAVSVNPLDWHILRGDPFLVRFMGYGLFTPKQQILGADIAGTVEAVGSGVTRFKTGDEVFGSGLGGFAEYACFRESKLVPKPASVTFENAAATPIAGLTALQGLRDLGGIQAGQEVLINGASGGVGTFAVQIAKHFGAHVTAVCSGKNAEMVRSIGADNVIDYTQEDFRKNTDTYDLILDNIGNQSVTKTTRALKPQGTYVMIAGSLVAFFLWPLIKALVSRKGGKKIASMITNMNATDLAYLSELLTSGKVVPVIDRTYSLADVPEAVRYVETGHVKGKVVIKVQS
jgi:NADPH:quinone reductase-like Zn-dependent oxidoreductase